MTITDVLETLGINRTYLGYWIIKDIVSVCVEDEEVMQDMKSFYEALAMKYNSQPSAIERNVRTATERAWKISKDKVKKMARYELSSMPSSSEFVDILVSFLLRQQRKSSVNHSNPC